MQSRLGYTPEQRRATLLSETEDVAREDQIVTGVDSGVSAMAESEIDITPLLNVVKTLYTKGKDFASKLFSRSFFDVAKTPDFMKQLGLRGDKFTIRYGVIARHVGKDDSHDLSEKDWERLPKALQTPFAITKLNNKKDSYRIYTTLQTKKGEYIVVGVEVKNAGRDLEVNAVSTAFGRRADANLPTNEDVIYTDTNITPDQSSLLERPNFAQYPTNQELSTDKGSDNVGDVQEAEKYSLRTNSQEVADIVAKAKADGTYMKAPNGKPTNLTEEQWANVRTKAFKDWLGDWELAQKVVAIISANKEHGFNNFAEARNWAKENIVGLYHNSEIGEVNISGKSIDKCLSGKAVAKSQSIDAHLSTIRVLPQLIENSIVGDIHEDRDLNSNLKDIVRLYGAIDIDGAINRVKITVKRYADESMHNKAYSYEVMEIEHLEGTLETTHTQGADFVSTSKSSINGANLLKGVENSKGNPILNSSKIVDENGEPMVVYHRTPNDFTAFDKEKVGGSTDWGAFGQGFYLSERDFGWMYGKNKMELFVNAKNPLFLNDQNAYEIREPFFNSNGAFGSESSVEFTKYVLSKGYDAVVYENGEEIVAFNPNQIKSATENVGTYSSESDDVRYSLRGTTDVQAMATDAVMKALEKSGI